ncbi:MAG: ABC transporter ATP-binding protein [Armatimonadota bacterium]
MDLELFSGEVLGIVGPNGAGKTTLIKCVAGLLEPDSGTVLVDGLDIRTCRRQIGFKLNLIGSASWTSFDWALSVKENLNFFACLYGFPRKLARERVGSAMEAVGLTELRHRMPSELSSGQRQRLSVARGLLTECPVLLLDEPTTGIDPVAARELRAYIREELRSRLGIGVILITHQLEEAESLCDRVAIMHCGKVLACKSPAMLAAVVPGRLVLELALERPPSTVRGELRELGGVRGVSEWRSEDGILSRIRVVADQLESTLPEVLRVVTGQGGVVLSAEVRPARLADAFSLLTKGGDEWI